MTQSINLSVKTQLEWMETRNKQFNVSHITETIHEM